MDFAHRVIIRPITPEDLSILLRWRNDDVFGRFCTHRRTKLSTKEDLDRELRADFARDRHRQVLIISRQANNPIGTMYSYGYNRDDGYLFVTIFIENQKRDKGLGAIALAVFCRELFEHFDLFKIYMDVYEHNVTVVEQLKRAGLKEEGCFKGHRREGTVRHDAIRFALYREILQNSFLHR